MFLLTSCASIVPVSNYFETAPTLGKGKAEGSISGSQYRNMNYGRNELTNQNIGFAAGYGLTDRIDLKIRYEKADIRHPVENGLTGSEYFSIVPKLSLVPERLSVFMNGFQYRMRYRFDAGKESNTLTGFGTHFTYTQPFWENRVSASMTFGGDATIGDSGGGLLGDSWGGRSDGSLFFMTQLGAAFSSDLNRWSVRPEVGITGNGDSRFWNYGISFHWKFSLGKE